MNQANMYGWKIMVDTNILFSFLRSPNSKIAKIIRYILRNHYLLLSDYIVNELKEKVNEKMPDKKDILDSFLKHMNIEILHQNADISEYADVVLRDIKDLPILATALKNEADALLTGDYDFLHMKGKNDFPVMILSVDEFIWIFGEYGLNQYLR